MIVEAEIKSSTFLCFTYVLPLIVVFALFHSNSYDIYTRTLDGASFDEYIKDLQRGKKDYRIISLTFVGEKSMDEFLKSVKLELSNFYEKYFTNSYIFRIRERRFILVYKDIKIPDAKELENRFKIEFDALYKQYQMDFKLFSLKEKMILKDHHEYISFLEFIESDKKNNCFYQVADKDYNEYSTYTNILKNIKEIKNDKKVEYDRVLTYIQSVYSIKDNKVTSFESLMRFKIDDEIINPNFFIPIAEANGAIHSLSLIIFNDVCKKIRELMNKKIKVDRISVNFSTNEFLDDNIYDDLKNIMDKYKVPYKKIGIEITESEESLGFDKLLSNIKKLKDLGITLYLDDYGTGYSNLERIMKSPIDMIKFDKSLLNNTKKDKQFKLMTSSIASNYHSLKYKVLFEGVETARDVTLCKKTLGADYLQGFHYSKPVPIDEIEK